MECKINEKKGFSLIEAIVVIVLISILVLLSFNVNDSAFKEAVMQEGIQLIEKIDAQIKLYRSQNDTFPTTSRVGSYPPININAVNNRYFREFDISHASGNNFTVNVYGSDKASGVTMNAVINSTTSIKQNLFYEQVEVYGL